MRILKFFAGFLAVTLLIFALVFGLNFDTFKTLLDNRQSLAEGSEWVEKTYSLKGLTEYIGEHPEMVSIVSLTSTDPDSSIYYQPDTPRTMGTLGNFLLMIAYADAFESGVMDSTARLSWDDITLYQLPQIDAANHKESYQYARSNGMIDQDNSIEVRDALKLLSRFNGLALSDYLLFNLEPERLDSLNNKLNLEFTDTLLPFSGLFLTLAPSIRGESATDILNYWRNRSPDQFQNQVYQNSERYSGGNQRDEWMNVLEKERLGVNFLEERDLLEFFPKTTARETARLILDVQNGRLISETVSRLVKQWLRWPMDDRNIQRNFTDYGALYDNRIGLLNGVDFGTSAYTGDTAAQAVFFDRMHVAVWFHMSSNHMHQDFQQRLIWDPALIEALKGAIS